MKHTEKQYINTNRNRKSVRLQKKRIAAFRRFLTGIFAVAVVLTFSFGFGSFFSSAHGNSVEEPVYYKYYKSIQIHRGDSLWSIAEKYMGTKYDSVNDYVDELIDLNHIEASKLNSLQEGDYLVIPYYDTRFTE